MFTVNIEHLHISLHISDNKFQSLRCKNINDLLYTHHLFHKILKQLCKDSTAPKKKKVKFINIFFGARLSPAAPRRTGILPWLWDSQVLLKNSREKTPGKKYVFNFTEVKLPISRPIPRLTDVIPPDLRPSHGVLSSLISRSPGWRSSLWRFGKHFPCLLRSRTVMLISTGNQRLAPTDSTYVLLCVPSVTGRIMAGLS